MKQKITIVGLGPGSEDELTLGAIKALKQGEKILLRTGRHGVASYLQEQGIKYETLDDYYEQYKDFDELYSAMVKRIAEEAEEGGLVLGVPGHPLVGERLVYELLSSLDQKVYHIEIIPGISRADVLTAQLQKGSPEGIKILVASELSPELLDTRIGTVILDLSSMLLASEVKLKLLRLYPDEWTVYLAWEKEGRLHYQALPLYEMDRFEGFDHTSCLYIPPAKLKDLTSFDFGRLVEIMEMLRSPEGCPWDREQDHESLKQYLIEETYEVLEAIDKKDYDKLLEELGDVLLQVVFHGQIAKERGEFDILDISSRVCQKMIDRHVHIFGDVKLSTADEVVDSWEAIKKKEKGLESQTQVLRDIPSNLPALMRAYKVQKKAALVGFDWDKEEDAVEKVYEELREVIAVWKTDDRDKIAEEIGDLLFAVVNVSRFLGVEPELALTGTIEKFIKRFEYIETKADKALEEMTLEEMDQLWNQAKSAFSSSEDV